MHLPFLTSNVPPTTFSTELKLEHLVPDSEMQLAQELAEYRPFNDVPVVLFSPPAGLRVAVYSNLAQDYGDFVRRLFSQSRCTHPDH